MFVVSAALAVAAGLAHASATASRTVADKRGDTRAADLDIRSAFVSVGARVRVAITTSAAMRDNAIYSAMFSCGQRAWQVAAKRAAGATTFFLFDWQTSRQTSVLGDFSGRRAILTVPLSKMRCPSGRFHFYVTAEGTNTRPPMTDRAPDRGLASVSS